MARKHHTRHSEPVSLSAEASAWEIADAMDEHGVGSVVITDAKEGRSGGKPIGIVTDRDLVRRVVAPGLDETKTLAADIMTRDPITADVDESDHELLETMSREGVRRLPLVHDGHLVALAASDDMLQAVTNELWNAAEAVRVELRQTSVDTRQRRRREAREELFEDARHYLGELESEARSRFESEIDGFMSWLSGKKSD